VFAKGRDVGRQGAALQDNLIEHNAVLLAAIGLRCGPVFLFSRLVMDDVDLKGARAFGFVDLTAIAFPKSDATMKGWRSSVSVLPSRHLNSSPSCALKRYSSPGLPAERHPFGVRSRKSRRYQRSVHRK
jgi:hypothetical protein